MTFTLNPGGGKKIKRGMQTIGKGTVGGGPDPLKTDPTTEEANAKCWT